MNQIGVHYVQSFITIATTVIKRVLLLDDNNDGHHVIARLTR
jgi:glutathione synthase/RimK-type ligase-like ATP-grasp enzyme